MLHGQMSIGRRVLSAVDASLHAVHSLRGARLQQKVELELLARAEVEAVPPVVASLVNDFDLAKARARLGRRGGTGDGGSLPRRIRRRRRGYALGRRGIMSRCDGLARGHRLLHRWKNRHGRDVGRGISYRDPLAVCAPQTTGRECLGVTLRGAQEGLKQSYDGGQAILNIGILGLDGLLGAYCGLELLVGLLRGQFAYPALQILDLVLGTLADSSLSLAICGQVARSVSWVLQAAGV